MSRPIVGKANKNPGRCAGLQLTVAAVRTSPLALLRLDSAWPTTTTKARPLGPDRSCCFRRPQVQHNRYRMQQAATARSWMPPFRRAGTMTSRTGATVLRNRGFFPIVRCCSKRQLDALPWTPAVDLRLLPHQEHCCHHTERACDAPRLVRVDTAWCTPTSSMHNAACTCTIPVIECTQEPFECSVYSSHSN